MPTGLEFLRTKLERRKAEALLRELRVLNSCVDFSSNDYLGFARSPELADRIRFAAEALNLGSGATGSRLLHGNSALAEELEAEIAKFHLGDAALLFNSGYDANIGLFSCIADRKDTFLYDELSHASIRDGIRLSLAQSFSFRHNDLQDLEKKIKQAQGNVFVAVESVYSMDGDCAPLEELEALKKQHENLHIIVDEAHANGIYGENGCGLASGKAMKDEIFARVYTFGKALGVHGAAVAGSAALRSYLINFARSFIYTTALPPHALISISEAYKMLPEADEQREKLQKNIKLFRQGMEGSPYSLLNSGTAIQSVIIPGNEKARKVAKDLQDKQLDVRAILSPSVPKGTERLRICLHAFNTEEEIKNLMEELS